MAFETSRFVCALLLCSCASPASFPLREPLLRDPDQVPVVKEPEEYYSPFAWDGANQTVFRPISRFFAVDPAGPAVNVNALDEVPDSSWFENRLGKRALSPADVTRGACAEKELDPGAPDGTWLIDKGKDNGANPGFRINVPGLGKFMLKSDPTEEPDRATGATSVASRVYYALGYYAPCDSVVDFRPSLLKLKPGLTVTNNQGVTKAFDEARLKDLLAHASHRHGLVRMVASQWLPGKPLGPYKYDGRRSDDPNDVIAHEDRRELRGARLVAAWLAHFDSREQNTMDVFMPVDPAKKKGPGYVRHYIIDMGDCFGSQWADDRISRRLNHAYALDVPYLTEDFLTLGAIERPWERAQLGELFGYFSARDFDPELWRGEYPNPAFGRMTEGDGAWMARILARFDEGLVRAAVAIGKYEPASERYLAETLIARRMAILGRYLSRLSPIGEVEANAQGVCGVDLARLTGVVPNESTSFRARAYRGAEREPTRALRLLSDATPRVCVELPHAALSSSVAPDDARRYVIVDLENGYARGPLRAHTYMTSVPLAVIAWSVSNAPKRLSALRARDTVRGASGQSGHVSASQRALRRNWDTPVRLQPLPMRLPSLETAGMVSAPAAIMTSANTPTFNYLSTVQGYPTVSREEELTLIRRWRAEQDESARDALVRSSLRHVVTIARRYQRYGIPLAELISEGNFGVVRALAKFDGARGTLFITYASYWVRACILQHVLRSWSIVGSGLPRSRLFFKLRRERAKLSSLIGDGAEARVILSERLGISEERLSALLQRVDQRDCSLDAELFQDGTLSLVNALPSPDPDLEQQALASEFGGNALAAVRDALTILDPRERYIVEHRFLADREAELSLADIGRSLGISRERARQLEDRAKRKLRARISSRPGCAGWLDTHRAA